MSEKPITIMEIITANELVSGASLYLSGSGRWLPDMQKALVFTPDEKGEMERQIARARNSTRLISVEKFAVTRRQGRIEAVRLRENIRAQGPTSPRHRPQTTQAQDHVSI